MKKLRLTKKEVCHILSIKSGKLDKLIKSDILFPKPYKEGNQRQSPVYFDAVAIEIWWNQKINFN